MDSWKSWREAVISASTGAEGTASREEADVSDQAAGEGMVGLVAEHMAAHFGESCRGA